MDIDLVLSPRDGLTVKDARGFDIGGGVTSGGLPWPGPSTTAGATRAIVGRLQCLSETYGEDKAAWREIANKVGSQGPIVVTRPFDGKLWVPLWPAPQDALRRPHLRAGQQGAPEGKIHWLEPRPRGAKSWQVRGLWTGPKEEVEATENLWLWLPETEAKPLTAQLLWSHNEIVDWLKRPHKHDEHLCIQPRERLDIHLAVDRESLAARDEHLFAHPTYEPLISTGRGTVQELGLALRITGIEPDMDLTEPVWRVGGEARFASARPLDPGVLGPEGRLVNYWKDSCFLRLLLVTPACFTAGWRPDWLQPRSATDGHQFEGKLPGLDRRVVLRAAFVDRAWWASGWDLAERRPKPSVACVAAGAVYYFESLEKPFTKEDIRQLWLSSIQRPEDTGASDGFGLVLPGAWPVTV